MNESKLTINERNIAMASILLTLMEHLPTHSNIFDNELALKQLDIIIDIQCLKEERRNSIQELSTIIKQIYYISKGYPKNYKEDMDKILEDLGSNIKTYIPTDKDKLKIKAKEVIKKIKKLDILLKK